MRTTASPNFRWQVGVVSLLIGLVASVGCVSTPKYPENWASGFPDQGVLLRPGHNCDLTGYYSDAGEVHPHQNRGTPPSLFRTLFPRSKLPSTVVFDTVAIKGPERGVLELMALKDGVLLEAIQLKEQVNLTDSNYAGRYLCLDNGLVYANSAGAGGGSPIAIGGFAYDNFLNRGKDGYLVLKRTDMTIVFPWWFQWKRRWYRFAPVIPGQETR